MAWNPDRIGLLGKPPAEQHSFPSKSQKPYTLRLILIITKTQLHNHYYIKQTKPKSSKIFAPIKLLAHTKQKCRKYTENMQKYRRLAKTWRTLKTWRIQNIRRMLKTWRMLKPWRIQNIRRMLKLGGCQKLGGQ
jgi:hypothetical protein